MPIKKMFTIITGRKCILYVFAIFLFFLFCSSSDKVLVFKNENKHKIPFKGYSLSNEKIDRFTTYEIYFSLEKPVKCIKAEIFANFVSDTFTGKTKPTKTFFIIEKIIDLSGFKNPGIKNTYTEIAKNFDPQWNRQKELVICGSDSDPFKTLDEKSPYRIRFTTFGNEEYEFEIVIFADCKTFFRDRLE